MRIGIIGDTHDQIPELKKALQQLKEQEIETLIHTGDWVSAFTLEYYKTLDCPIRGVWGNNIRDPRFPALAKKNGLDLVIEETLSLEMDGRRIQVLHELGSEPITHVDLVVYGHDHKPVIETRDGIQYVNAGTLLHETFPWLLSTPSYAVYDTRRNQAELVYLE